MFNTDELRRFGDGKSGDVSGACRWAADEIERLRRAGFGGLSYDIAEKQRQEIERLRGLVNEVVITDPYALTSVLAETGWFKRAHTALSTSQSENPQ